MNYLVGSRRSQGERVRLLDSTLSIPAAKVNCAMVVSFQGHARPEKKYLYMMDK